MGKKNTSKEILDSDWLKHSKEVFDELEEEEEETYLVNEGVNKLKNNRVG